SRASAFTGLFGGGVRYAMAERWGLRFDLRDYVSQNKTSTLVSAAPTVDRNPSFLAITTISFFNGPSLRMSTVPGTPSTLSGTLSNQPTFRGTGIGHQINLSIGAYWRF